MVSLVTGAFGFLGGYIRARLAERSTVVAVGRPEMEVPSADFDSLLSSVRPAVVVHCAGPASVPNSVVDPAADFQASVTVTFDLLERLRRLPRPPRVVFLSSAAVYGDPPLLPVGEHERPRPISPYGHHKLICEQLLWEFYELYGLPSATLRVFSAYGDGLRRQIFWDMCVQAIADGAVRLRGDGTESRDFVHAEDVASAVELVLDHAPFEAETFNVASGVETPIAELATLVVARLGVDVPVIFSGVGRIGDPVHWRADLRRIEALGFRPSITLAEGVSRYAVWASRQLIPA